MKGGGFGLLMDIVIGMVGSIIGGWLFGMVGLFSGGGLIGSVLVAFVGACILLWLVRLIKKASALHFSVAPLPAASPSRAICVQARRRTADIIPPPRRTSSSNEIGGNPAVPSSEFTSARFSDRSLCTSSSSINTYRPRNFLPAHSIIVFHIIFAGQAPSLCLCLSFPRHALKRVP